MLIIKDIIKEISTVLVNVGVDLIKPEMYQRNTLQQINMTQYGRQRAGYRIDVHTKTLLLSTTLPGVPSP